MSVKKIGVYAARVLGFKRSGIKECLRGKSKTYKKFIWKYKVVENAD